MLKITVLSHDLSSNAVMRAHRIAEAVRTFAEVKLIGPINDEPWPALPTAVPGLFTVPKQRFPAFYSSFQQLVEAANGDVLIPVKPHLASFGVALLAAEKRSTPVILDIDDLDTALVPESEWEHNPSVTDLSRPGSAIYLSLLTRATAAASQITVSSTALQTRFGGTVILHGCDTARFDPSLYDREVERRKFGFDCRVVLFPGTVRPHKGLYELAKAMRSIKDVRLCVTCRPADLMDPDWDAFPLMKIPFVPYSSLPGLLSAADIIAIPQLNLDAAIYQTPMKVFEAMAMAKPVVASRIGDLPEILRDCGTIVPPGDIGALAQSIAVLLDEPEQARQIGRAARLKCIEHYSTPNVARRFKEVISKVLPNATFAGNVSVPQTHEVVNVDLPPSILADLQLPLLSRALDPVEVQWQFTKSLRHLCGKEGQIEIRSIRAVRYKPGKRCLIEYDLTIKKNAVSEPVMLLGKAVAKKNITGKHQVLESFWQAGFNDQSADLISIPEPVALIPEYQMSLQRKVPGIPSTLLLWMPEAHKLTYRIAEALNKLHCCNVPTARTHTMDDELETLRRGVTELMRSRPDLQKRLEKILEACESLAATVPPPNVCGIHRDFYPDQVIVNGDRLYVVDLDLYAMGDPSLDAGNFLAHLTELSLRQFGHGEGFRKVGETFESRFLEISKTASPVAINVYSILTMVRHIYLSTRFEERRGFTESILHFCEENLLPAVSKS